MSSSFCDAENVTGVVEVILRDDLESLSRGFSFEERLEYWNMVRVDFSRYLRECARGYSKDVDRLIRGKYMLAQLMLAASFRVNGEDVPEVTGSFTEEEYNVLMDLEELKEIDFLSVQDLVEFIERREGRVYEMVKKYYERGYYMLDRKWTGMRGHLALALAERYKERRMKIEEAVIEYIKRRPLTVFIGEIEEAVRKALEARKAREEAARAARRAEEGLERVEALVSTPAGVERLTSIEEAVSLVNRLARELEETRRRLLEKEEELERIREKYAEESSGREIVEAELEALRGRMRELEALLDEYKASLSMLEAEKTALTEKLQELKEGLEGVGPGNLVSSEEAWALENSLVERIYRKLSDGVKLFDPVRGEARSIVWTKRIYYSLRGGGKPQGKGIQLQLLRGLVRKRKDVVVDAVTLIHADEYDTKGWDQKPASLGDLMQLLEDRLGEAGGADYYHILVISSPTGFTEKAKNFVGSSGPSGFASRNITLYLVDPVRGELYYNRMDPAAEANKWIADPMLPEEQVNRVLEYLKSREARAKAIELSPSAPYLTAEIIADDLGVPLESVVQALAKAENEGIGKVLLAEGNVKAFFYRTSI